MTSTSSSRNTALFFLLYIAAVLPLCFLGYGSDNDTYGVLEAGRSTWHAGHPMTSRNPGYWLYEALVYGVGHWGGSLATNIASMGAGAFILWRFLCLSRKIGVRHPYILACCVLFVPTFLIAASSTIGYLWSIAFLIAAAELLLDSRFALASLAGAIAIGFRGSNALVLAGAYAGLLVYSLVERWKGRQVAAVVLSGVVAACLGMLFFLPSWWMAHRTLAFLTPGIGPAAMWTLKMHIGRFFYKIIYVFGPVATLILLFLLARNWKATDLSSFDSRAPKAFAIFLGAFLGNLILFGKFPVEVSYLLPGVVFFLLLAGISFLGHSRAGAIAVLCGVLSFNVFSISLAKPNIPLRATNAQLSISPERGLLLEDIRLRLQAKPCDSVACWAENVHQQPAL